MAAAIAALAGAAAGRSFLGSPAVISGLSMAPTYQPGAWVYTAPISGSVERGDVVVLDDGNDEYAIKRVIGMPGETIHLWRGYVFINNQILFEPYVPKRVYTFPTERLAVFVLGPTDYFVLGDNRPSSADSRAYGPVERQRLKRRVDSPNAAPARPYLGSFRLPDYRKVHLKGRPVPKLGEGQSHYGTTSGSQMASAQATM